MLQIYEKIAEKIAHKRVFLTFLKQSKKYINYRDSELKGKVIAQLNLQNASLETALDTILKGTGFSFQIQGNYIIIAEKKPVVAQTLKNIKGKVTDESGEPLIGVNISVDGSSTGTITDFDGIYSQSILYRICCTDNSCFQERFLSGCNEAGYRSAR